LYITPSFKINQNRSSYAMTGYAKRAHLSYTAICRIVGSAMRHANPPTARLETRLPHAVMGRLKRAAEIRGCTVTDFVVAAADEAACRAIEETEIIRLSIEGQRQIAAAILNPPAATPALKKAAKRYRGLCGAQ
jgi:uncharacterized protein (DUF1778 family)